MIIFNLMEQYFFQLRADVMGLRYMKWEIMVIIGRIHITVLIVHVIPISTIVDSLLVVP